MDQVSEGSTNFFFSIVKELGIALGAAIKNGLFPLAVVVVVILLNFIFYSWSDMNGVYLGAEFLLFFLLLLSSFWNIESRKNRISALTFFVLFFGMDMLFSLTIIIQEGINDYLNVFLGFLDALGLISSFYWFLNQF
ncbi:MAG: hypothetical protein D6732_09810 [Methanobacteriota archaeon]|nr:MAG: hypothetical protein D6732_09810 [Euryarchaeota archaeon]